MIDFDPTKAAHNLVPVFHQANELAISLRQQGLQVSRKRDGSLVTNADVAIEQLIGQQLKHFWPSIPVVGEEELALGVVPTMGNSYWMLDPIDGTSGYAQPSDEFAISLGLIEQGRPVFGIISLPSSGMIYVGSVTNGKAYQIDARNNVQEITCKNINTTRPMVVHSRHESAHKMRQMFGKQAAFIPMGSARKFVMMATGQADYYVRTFGLSEYDIAGGHALVEAAGCRVAQTNGQPILYGDPSLYVGSFVISAKDITG